MSKYQIIRSRILDKLNNGEITMEEATRLNVAAYEKYGVITESAKDDDEELLDDLKDLVKDGSVELSKDLRKSLKELLASAKKEEENEEEEDEEEGEEEEEDEMKESVASLIDLFIEKAKCKKHPDDCDCEECKNAKLKELEKKIPNLKK